MAEATSSSSVTPKDIEDILEVIRQYTHQQEFLWEEEERRNAFNLEYQRNKQNRPFDAREKQNWDRFMFSGGRHPSGVVSINKWPMVHQEAMVKKHKNQKERLNLTFFLHKNGMYPELIPNQVLGPRDSEYDAGAHAQVRSIIHNINTYKYKYFDLQSKRYKR